MSKGPSGRIVIEIDPATKQRMHAALALQGRTVKSWFLEEVGRLLKNAGQLQLDLPDGSTAIVEPEA